MVLTSLPLLAPSITVGYCRDYWPNKIAGAPRTAVETAWRACQTVTMQRSAPASHELSPMILRHPALRANK
jgi:hypothetical protein